MSTLLTDFIRLFNKHDVEVVLVGGWAAILHGSARATIDIDFVYSRSDENLMRLAEALASHSPYLRDAPAGLPFTWDVATIKAGLNFTLSTDLGSLDLMGEIAGGGTYQQLLPFTQLLQTEICPIRCVTLECLIQLKRAAGRPKDLEALAELNVLLDERN